MRSRRTPAARFSVFVHAAAAELIKLRTLPAALFTMLATVVVPPSIALAMGLNARATDAPSLVDPHTQGFEVGGLGQPLIIVLAAILAGSEYRHGLLRSSLLATPNRVLFLTAKMAVICGCVFALAVASLTLAVVLRQATLGTSGLAITEFSPGMWFTVLTIAINWTLMSVVSASLTILARSALLPVVVLVPMVLGVGVALVGVLPWLKYAPDLAGLQLISPYPGAGLLDPLPGAMVLLIWATALLGASVVVSRRRDA